MINNLESTFDYISNWLKKYLDSHNKDSIIFELTDSSSYLLYYLAAKTRKKLICFSESNKDIESNLFNIEDIIKIQINSEQEKEQFKYSYLHSIASSNNGIVISNIVKNEYDIFRSYIKHGRGSADLYPLADLFFSETIELLDYHLNKIEENNNSHIESQDMKDSEWIIKEELSEHIITNQTDPTKNKAWLRYSAGQREMISKAYSIEKQSRHKINMSTPICSVRQVTNLIK